MGAVAGSIYYGVLLAVGDVNAGHKGKREGRMPRPSEFSAASFGLLREFDLGGCFSTCYVLASTF